MCKSNVRRMMRMVWWEFNKPHWITMIIYYLILTALYFLLVWSIT